MKAAATAGRSFRWHGAKLGRAAPIPLHEAQVRKAVNDRQRVWMLSAQQSLPRLHDAPIERFGVAVAALLHIEAGQIAGAGEGMGVLPAQYALQRLRGALLNGLSFVIPAFEVSSPDRWHFQVWRDDRYRGCVPAPAARA